MTTCPACGGTNEPDAVFCANDKCRKALGPFRYAAEEIDLRARWHERVAERVVGWVGHSSFFAVHLLWFAVWWIINAGSVRGIHPFDLYPYGLLGILLAGEAILLTGFVLISQNRQQVRGEIRTELDYEVNVRTYREVQALGEAMRRLEERMERMSTER
ncbi:MAG: DUF1003 domain-containing protein [Gemmatimonadetes bacterium]|nr:MAG: DUF1003 domain-containing protein [Gemmatimonadota bacterium]